MNLEETKKRLSTINFHIDEFRSVEALHGRLDAVQRRRLDLYRREAKRLRQMIANETHRQAAG